MTVKFNNTKSLKRINEDKIGGIKSGVTEIFKYVNKLTHLNHQEIITAANRLRAIVSETNDELEIKKAIENFQRQIEISLDNITNTIIALKKVRD
jgi:ADP-dependent phosphofructokinase/glucokinase